MDKTTILGFVIGLSAIIFGQLFEGGHLSDLIQGTAALIVIGGTMGAVLVSTPLDEFVLGIKLTKKTFIKSEISHEIIISEIVSVAQSLVGSSIADLEKKIKGFSHPEMRSIFRLIADGVDATSLREIVQSQINYEEENLYAGAKIWSDAGGFAPTIGIIGAVLGLIHVMSNLSDTSKLGSGIAVAFVATIYGVASANLIFLPLCNKIKRFIRRNMATKEMILEGAISILEGKSPYIIREKLKSFNKESINMVA